MKTKIYKIILFTLILTATILEVKIFTQERKERKVNTIYVHKKYTDWELLKVAIIWQESRAINLNKYQITKIYVDEVNEILKYNRYKYSDVYDERKSEEMFEIYNARHNPNKDIDRGIYLHGPRTDKYFTSVKDKFNMLKYLNEKYQ